MDVEIADSPRKRLLGLIGRPLRPGHALMLERTRSIHTFGIRGALDLVWIDAERRVVRVDEAVPSCRIRTCRKASSVIECPPGDARRVLAWL